MRFNAVINNTSVITW